MVGERHAVHLSQSDVAFRARLELILAEDEPFIKVIENSAEDEAGAMLEVDLDESLDRNGGELTEAYAVENGEVKMTKDELISMIARAGFEAVERDAVFNRVAVL